THCSHGFHSYLLQVKSVRYSRFTLQPTDSGERHAEVKLSDDGTEEITEVEAGGSPSFRPALPNRSRRSIAYLVLGTLLIFITGMLSCSANSEDLFYIFDLPSRSAGSDEDMSLANRIFDGFKELEMDPWTDIHYVQLPMPDRLLSGLLPELKVCLFFLQVDNAEKKGASAVLIFPDFEDYEYRSETALYGHVHLGSGDPYTPGFPSFNHTQFPPTQSSGLPKILAQTITYAASGFKGSFKSVIYSLGGVENITVEVNNVLVNKELHNVFGVIKGFDDPDRYIVLGAQRDAWGRGYARATVGTSVLTELAKAFHEMVENDGFRPRRSLVFASWSAGEYGSIGATEWLEGYMASIDKSVFTYISLDGDDTNINDGSFFFFFFSPPIFSPCTITLYFPACRMRPMTIDDPAYPFLAFSGIPSVSFHFITPNSEVYTYYGTHLDDVDQLSYETNRRTGEITVAAAQFAGQMALHLVHDHLLSLDMSRYSNTLTKAVVQVYRHIQWLSQSGKLKDLSPNWLNRARGSFQRAARGIYDDIASTNLDDKEACRILNDRIMRVEHNLLSPYVSPVEVPFRHLLFGRGSHTLASISEATDMDELRTQLALATWNLQGCANAMVGDIWDLDEEI
uniref:Transferrin receptor 1b n=1 Tax=Amphilophus citrinellus TaxID=61819 RepID=A0A3Q0T5A9_AMPCI